MAEHKKGCVITSRGSENRWAKANALFKSIIVSQCAYYVAKCNF